MHASSHFLSFILIRFSSSPTHIIIENQKKIWIAEHKHAEREKREAEAAAQLAREADAYHHEEMMKRKGGGSHMGMLATDQEKKNESASMAFLYAKPPGIAEVRR